MVEYWLAVFCVEASVKERMKNVRRARREESKIEEEPVLMDVFNEVEREGGAESRAMCVRKSDQERFATTIVGRAQ